MTTPHLSRRKALSWLGIGAAVPVLGACGSPAEARSYRVSFTEAQWREKLSKQEFTVLRKAGTERPYSSPLNKVKRAGTYICADCDNALFASRTKFESGTGWPSF